MAKISMLIAGGGDTVETLLKDPVLRDLIDQVVIIENDPDRRLALERLGDVLVIEGNATDTSIYENIDMSEVDVVLALTSKDEVNFLVLAIATQFNVPIRIGVFKDDKVAEIVKNLKLGIPVIKPAITAGVIKQMLTSLVNPRVVAQLSASELRIYAVTIREDDLAAYTKLEELHLEEENAQVLMVYNGKEIVPAQPDMELVPGHILFILAQDEKFLGKIKGITSSS
ncbi:MAG: NAD-binding protein [Desulfurococcaceae archaeon]